jgi:hypothetical protein
VSTTMHFLCDVQSRRTWSVTKSGAKFGAKILIRLVLGFELYYNGFPGGSNFAIL